MALEDFTQESAAPDESQEDSVLKGIHLPRDDEIDITPMIDLTFLLLVFFMVSSVPSDPELVIDLPQAVNAGIVRSDECVIISIAYREKSPAAVYFADGKKGQPLRGDWKAQEEMIRQYVERGLLERKKFVLLKAEKGVKVREVHRVAQAATSVPDAQLHVAVFESDE